MEISNSDLKFYESLLNRLKFDELQTVLLAKDFEEMRGILYRLAFDPDTGNHNLLVYTFCQSLLYKRETSELHWALSVLIGSILNHVDEAAEHIGLYHGLRALELDPENIDLMEFLIYFNHIPEKLLDDASAIRFAQKIIEVRPDSMVAKITLGKLNYN